MKGGAPLPTHHPQETPGGGRGAQREAPELLHIPSGPSDNYSRDRKTRESVPPTGQ